MLQITEWNISFKLGLQKTRVSNYDWKSMGDPNKGAKWSLALLEIGAKNQNF